MKLSQGLIGTLREVPAEAEIKSHQLMLRSGMIKKAASGVYNYMPLGLRALKNIEAIVREEMDQAGAQEFLASALLPAELWRESGRWDAFGPEMFRLKDRNGRDFCLGPTHEEVFTDIARSYIKSYKQLPLNLYQIQNKFRDERRPRFGLMRSREFIMKDAYSFDKDEAGLDHTYNKMYGAYHRIFERCGLTAKCVEADSGAMGGSASAEFMIQSDVGEDEVVFCSKCDYAANSETASAAAMLSEAEELKTLNKVETPEVKTIEDLVAFFNTTAKSFAKTLIYKADDKIVAVMVRGDREVNETKAANAVGGPLVFVMADADTVMKATSAAVGFAGPIGIQADTLLVDREVAQLCNGIVGANDTGYHYENVNYGRDFTGTVGDYRNVVEGDTCARCGAALEIARGIEVGHIFKLGIKYSKAMGANFIDETGEARPLVMGCYGIGISRILAAVVEQHNDENGIIWPVSVAPYKVVIVPVVIQDAEVMRVASRFYDDLSALGIAVLMDDRDERAGIKFKDVDLIGIPIRITVGRKIGEGLVEYKERKEAELELVEIQSVLDRVKQSLGKL